MAATHDTLRLIADLRRELAHLIAGVTRTITGAWVRAWDRLSVDVALAVDELLKLRSAQGAWPSRAAVRQSARTQQALQAARTQLDQLAATARTHISSGVAAAAALGADRQAATITSQLPPGHPIGLTAAAAGALLAARTVADRTVNWVTALLPAAGTAAISDVLDRGVPPAAGGQRSAGRALMALAESAFNVGLARAVNVAVTEIQDAHRAAAAAAHTANRDLLTGWVWVSELSPTTCPACWAMHGTIHPLAEPGPLDHQCGRCERIPVIAPWAVLGITTPEQPSVLPDAQAVFAGLPVADQRRIMGPTRLRMLQSGEISWADLALRRDNPDWRSSYAARPVKDLAAA